MVIDIGQIVHTLPRLTVNVYDIMLLTKQQPEWREEKNKKTNKPNLGSWFLFSI